MSSVELNHYIITKKLKILRQFASAIAAVDIPNDKFVKLTITNLTSAVVKFENEYHMNTSPILVEYYRNESGTAYDRYKTLINSNNYNGILAEFISTINNIFIVIPTIQSKDILKIITEYNKISSITNYVKNSYNKCECGNVMELRPHSSEMICTHCGLSLVLEGVLFETDVVFNLMLNAPTATYDPHDHCGKWINKIQATEVCDIPKKCLNAIITYANSNKLKWMSCDQIRKFIKPLKFSKYNDHIPLIRKRVFSYSPPQLTADEIHIITALFAQSIKTYDIVKPASATNNMYYPYVIYKIIDIIIKDSPRKRYILECIHLQKSKTLVKHDGIWHTICAKHPELQYRPTNRHDQISIY